LRIWGIHAVEAVVRNPRRAILKLRLTDNALHRMREAVARRGIEPEEASPRDLDRLLGADTVHQGALVETEALEEPGLADLVATGVAGPALLVVLDQVTDPHNVGAILRSAAAFGAAGLVMTTRHSPPLAGALAKVASGALEQVAVVHVPNLARALAELGELGCLRVGLDGGAETAIEDCAEIDRGRAVALVLGGEERGLRQLTRETCDLACRISTPGTLASLNVSNAAAVALYAVRLRRRR
jgi:23S rRNA (guanosine2251-2'-O)-methyltransferase